MWRCHHAHTQQNIANAAEFMWAQGLQSAKEKSGGSEKEHGVCLRVCMCVCVRESRNGEELMLAKIHLLFPERRQRGKREKSYAITKAKEEKLVLFPMSEKPWKITVTFGVRSINPFSHHKTIFKLIFIVWFCLKIFSLPLQVHDKVGLFFSWKRSKKEINIYKPARTHSVPAVICQ